MNRVKTELEIAVKNNIAVSYIGTSTSVLLTQNTQSLAATPLFRNSYRKPRPSEAAGGGSDRKESSD